MPLRTILARVAADMGYTLSSASERTYVIDRIQEAARTLYETHDLPGCEREQIFKVEVGQQLITFPWYVKKILRIRDYEYRSGVDVVDMRPRYQSRDWTDNSTNSTTFWTQWRKTGVDGLTRRITGASKLKFTFAAPVTSAVAVTVNGSTDTAGRITETLLFNVGDQTKVSTNLFTGVTRNGIKKTAVTVADLSVTDGAGNEVCLVPNHMLTVEHLVIQNQDRYGVICERLIECLYKTAYEPMYEDEDCFMLGEEYEEALFYQTMAMLYAKQEGKQDMVTVMGQAAQAQLTAIAASIQPDDSDIMDIGSNNVYNVMNSAGYMPRSDRYAYYRGSRI